MKSIPFIDLKKQYQQIRGDVLARIERVLEHQQFIMGPEVAECEKALAAFVGVEHCVTVASGTDALLLPLMAWGVGPGDEVITTPFSFFGTAEVIVLLGATPVFVDIEERTYNIDPARIEEKITPRTRAIMPVSLYGQPADLDPILDIGNRHGVKVIEDGCQSFGGVYKGRRSCSLRDAGATSFFPSKPLGCYGDGGAIFTDDDELADRLRQIRTHGQRRRYEHAVIGINARFDTLQAAVLLAKMPLLEEELDARQEVARRYDSMLGGIEGVVTPHIESHNVSAWAQYSLQVANRESVQESLKAEGIPTAVHYPMPLHLQPALAAAGGKRGDFPISERVSERIVSIPMDPWLTEDVQRRVADALERAVAAPVGPV